MPCLVGCLALSAPRFVIVLVVVFSDYIGRAFETTLWPFIGFLFMPLTTLAYAWAINSRGSVTGFALAVVVLAALIDLGLIGGSASRRHRARADR
jgi:FtsH-binding integral membrane protein